METDRFLAELVRYAKGFYQEWPESVSIRLQSGKKIVLPVPPSLCQEAPAAKIPTIDGVSEELAQAIFCYLDDEGSRRTREQVAAALSDQFGEGTVHKALWKMRLAGILDNKRKDGGYGIAIGTIGTQNNLTSERNSG